jgi:hypothetical protein
MAKKKDTEVATIGKTDAPASPATAAAPQTLKEKLRPAVTELLTLLLEEITGHPDAEGLTIAVDQMCRRLDSIIERIATV